jgi:hypothetical protein
MPPYWLRLRAAQAFGNKGVVGLSQKTGRCQVLLLAAPLLHHLESLPASGGEAVAGPEGK